MIIVCTDAEGYDLHYYDGFALTVMWQGIR